MGKCANLRAVQGHQPAIILVIAALKDIITVVSESCEDLGGKMSYGDIAELGAQLYALKAISESV